MNNPITRVRNGSMVAVFVSLAALTLLPAAVVADTVYLKNGAWIDGIVGYRTDTYIELEIGKIGKLAIPIEEIYEIEKNKRTGLEKQKTYVAPTGSARRMTIQKNEEKSSGSQPGAESVTSGPDGDGDAQDDSTDPLADESEEIDEELKETIEEHVADLQRQKARYRVRAERHLKAIGRPAVPFLIPLLRNENDLTRVAVARLFHAFGDERVIEPCIEALLDVNEYVRDYANKTLIRVTGENFGYIPHASPRRRETAQRKWARWWQDEKKELEKAREAARHSEAG